MFAVAADLLDTSKGPNHLHSGLVVTLFVYCGRESDWVTPGSEADIRYQNEVGDCEFKWMREYGSAWRRTGCFGVSVYSVQHCFPFSFLTRVCYRETT